MKVFEVEVANGPVDRDHGYEMDPETGTMFGRGHGEVWGSGRILRWGSPVVNAGARAGSCHIQRVCRSPGYVLSAAI